MKINANHYEYLRRAFNRNVKLTGKGHAIPAQNEAMRAKSGAELRIDIPAVALTANGRKAAMVAFIKATATTTTAKPTATKAKKSGLRVGALNRA